MDSTKRLYVALGALAVGGFLVFQQTKKESTVEQAHSLAAAQGELPSLSISEETTKLIDTIELDVAPEKEQTDDKKSERITVTLTKKGEEEWRVTKPLDYNANINNVTSLLKNLTSLKLTEQVSQRTDAYDKFGVTAETALHAVFKKGDEVVLDAFFGNNGSRGQMTRLEGKDGVFAVAGFSRYLYARDVDAWRDKSLFKFDDAEAAKVTVNNENGEFVFTRGADKWEATLGGKPLERFKASKVDDLLRAYKNLNASAFGDGKAAADVGLGETPTAKLTIELKDGKGQHQLLVGDTSEGTARWVKVAGRDEVFSVSAWAADWALGDAKKFQEVTDEEKAKDPSVAKHMPKLNPHEMPKTGVAHSNPPPELE